MADQGWSRNCVSLVLQTSRCLPIESLATVVNVVGAVNVVNNVHVAAVLRNSLAPFSCNHILSTRQWTNL